MDVMSVTEAADELEVSSRRVLQLVASGKLRGEQLGWGWVVDPVDVERIRRHRGEVGRPWSPVAAWAVLALAGGEQPDVSPVERSGARKRLAQHGLLGLAGRLRARAEPHWYYAHPSALERLVHEPGLVRGGASAASDHDAGLIAGDLVEAYIARSRLAALVKRFALDPNAERPNVLLRLIDDEVWPFVADVAVAPWPVVAVDLLEADDERSQRAGRGLIERLA
jgi:excisionase family DNA binding protein